MLTEVIFIGGPMLKLSLSSRVLDGLGRAFIASTSKLQMPHDFYFVPGDRLLPSSAEYAQPRTRPARIAVDAFRRRLLLGVALASSAGGAAACAVLSLFARAIAHH
jgi:hypothetical protein